MHSKIDNFNDLLYTSCNIDCISFHFAFRLKCRRRCQSQRQTTFLHLKSECNIWSDCHVIMQSSANEMNVLTVDMEFLLRVLCVFFFSLVARFVVVSAIQAKPIEKCTLFSRVEWNYKVRQAAEELSKREKNRETTYTHTNGCWLVSIWGKKSFFYIFIMEFTNYIITHGSDGGVHFEFDTAKMKTFVFKLSNCVAAVECLNNTHHHSFMEN